MDDSFNLEEEYGGLLDLIESNIDEISSGPSAMHYGVKGMHWGVRKERDSSPRKTREPLKSLGPDSVTRKTKSGETITLKKVPPNKIHKFLDRVSKKYREGYSKQAMLDILDSSGKKVGDAHVEKRNDEELYLNWLGIDKSARGKGYATAVMQAGRDFGKEQGFKRMTLEVPGNSPDARHIYEKIGFKVTKEAEDSNDAWGGLTEMAYEFDASHSELVHYGVKGMHWGVRRAELNKRNPGYTANDRAKDRRSQSSGGAVRRINKRMNKGQDLTTARKNETKFVKRRKKAVSAAVLGVRYRKHIAAGARLLKVLGPLALGVAVQSVAQRAETNRGRAFVANTMGIPQHASTGPSATKQNRKGVYNISSL